MKKLVLLGIVLFCAGIAHAQLVIEQVYANPKGTESGGEAVLLRNFGNQSVSLENWTLATQASVKDVVFPAVTVGPNQNFLVADTGWSEKKDDSLWRGADLEDTITLANENGGVALVDPSGITVDAVGWGAPEQMKFPLFTGTPAPVPPEQNVLRRVSTTGNNVQDFVISDPSFESDDIILLVVTVANNSFAIKEVIVLPDENPKEGTQVNPPDTGAKRVVVRAIVDGSLDDDLKARLAGKTVDLEQLNETVYEGVFLLDASFPAGNHSIEVFAGDTTSAVVFEYLPRRKMRIANNQLSLASVAGQRTVGEVVLQNQGNTKLNLQALLVGNNSLGDIKISLDNIVFRQPQDTSVTLAAGESKKVFVAVEVPKGMRAGTYRTRLRFREAIA